MIEEPFSEERLRYHLQRAKALGEKRAGVGLFSLAMAVLSRARERVISGGSHSYGTPTPASPGGGPAIISGQLRQSLAEEKIAEMPMLTYRVGTQDTTRRPYKRSKMSIGGAGGKLGSAKTSTNATVGAALELGMGYVFLKPAFEESTRDVEALFTAKFAPPWEA